MNDWCNCYWLTEFATEYGFKLWRFRNQDDVTLMLETVLMGVRR